MTAEAPGGSSCTSPSYPLIIPYHGHPKDVSLEVLLVCLAGWGEGAVKPGELGPAEGLGVLLPDAQVDGGGQAGLTGEMSEGLGQREEGEEW